MPEQPEDAEATETTDLEAVHEGGEPVEIELVDGDAASAGDPTDLDPADELDLVKAERDAALEKALRAAAEVENIRKRAQRQEAESLKYRAGGVAKDLFPVDDNLRRALEAAGASGNTEELITGVGMVVQQFEQTLESHGVVKIAADGEKFDPNVHEAVTQVPSPDHEPMTVIQVVEDGYRLYDRVLRPAKVIVAAAT
ncbi:MAG: nucleotide exchange factor GrpE [Planctomycetota bacterium]